MQIEEHSAYYNARKSMLIKISGDGAKYNRSNTFLLMSFAFIRSYTEGSSEVNSNTSNYTAHQGSGLSSAGMLLYSYLSS